MLDRAGRAISFWFNSWNGAPLVETLLLQPTPACHGMALSQTMARINTLLPNLNPQVQLTEQEDSRFWRWEVNGLYSAKSV